MLNPLITAIRTLTIFPIPGKDTEHFSVSMLYFPLVGAIQGGIVCGIAYSIQLFFSSVHFLTAIIAVSAAVLTSGSLHLDGFADCADAFGGGHTKDAVLRILKDSRIGTFGTVALFLLLGAKIISYDFLLQKKLFAPIVVSIVLSRSLQAVIFSTLPYARGKEGTGFLFSRSSNIRLYIITEFIICCTVSILFIPLRSAVPMIIAGSSFSALFCLLCMKKINGITGDCVGAASELFELFFLFAAVAVSV